MVHFTHNNRLCHTALASCKPWLKGQPLFTPPEEWEAYDSEPPDDPDNWQDEADE